MWQENAKKNIEKLSFKLSVQIDGIRIQFGRCAQCCECTRLDRETMEYEILPK